MNKRASDHRSASKHTGVNIETIRYYERIGILPKLLWDHRQRRGPRDQAPYIKLFERPEPSLGQNQMPRVEARQRRAAQVV